MDDSSEDGQLQLMSVPPIEKPGRTYPGVGTGAVVVHQGHVLLVKRMGAEGEGTWSVPGGWVEWGEDVWECAKRETFEETKVVVTPYCSLGYTPAVHPDTHVHAVTLWVGCTPIAGKPTVTEPDKCPEVAWVPGGDVLAYPLFEPFRVAWPYLMLGRDAP